MFIVYVLKSKVANKSYVGSTDNIERRLKEHNDGKSLFSKRHRPWDLVYQEEYINEADARRRERYLKTTSGRRFLKKVFSQIQ